MMRSNLTNTIVRCVDQQFRRVSCSDPTAVRGVPRSPADETGGFGRVIEFTADYSLLHEGEGRVPFAFLARATIEGAANFRQFFTPNIQLVFSRSITDRAEVYLVPSFSFNTNPQPKALIDQACTSSGICQSRHTVSLGIGLTVRPIPQTKRLAFVGEIIPRVAGFSYPALAGEGGPQIGVRPLKHPSTSFGVQFKTYRHVFEFVITNSQGMTTSRYILGGDIYRLGFNIYRQMR
jgi:hypothetical protein